MLQRNKEMRPKGATTGKLGKCYPEIQEDHWTGVRGANCKIRGWVTYNQERDIVEGSPPYETVEEPTRIVGVRETRDVGAPATPDNFAHAVGTERDKKRLMFGHLD
jgi:hypothetical protein